MGIPLLGKEGWPRPKKYREATLAGAAGVVNHPVCATKERGLFLAQPIIRR